MGENMIEKQKKIQKSNSYRIVWEIRWIAIKQPPCITWLLFAIASRTIPDRLISIVFLFNNKMSLHNAV